MMTQSEGALQDYTERLVRYAAGFRFDRLPEEAVAEIKTLVLDSLGAMLAASHPRYSSTRLVVELVRQIGGREECSVVGRDFKTSVEGAALANGTMGYAADIEGARAARQHVAAVLVPTMLAIGERQRAPGKTCMAALALGYEICCRVGEACRTAHSYPHSFHPSAVFGQIGAAAVAGHVLGLDEGKFANAFGLAATTATGLMTWLNDPTENSRPFVIGVAARGGVTAGLLAGLGYGGPGRIFDPGKYDIYDAFAGEAHPERLVDGLGDHLWLLRNDGYKQYACCGDIHTGLDSLLRILEEQRLVPDEIARIVLRVKADRAPVIDGNPLRSHCAQYIMGVAAVRRRIDLDVILEDCRSDPRVRAAVERVVLIGDPELDKLPVKAPAIVEVKTLDGREFVCRTDHPKGSRQSPMSHAELEEKFYRLAGTVMDLGQARRLREAVSDLDGLEDMRELMSHVRVGPRAAS